jgi:hypothetical protein
MKTMALMNFSISPISLLYKDKTGDQPAGIPQIFPFISAKDIYYCQNMRTFADNKDGET